MQPQIGPSSTIEAIGKYVHVLVELIHLLHEDGLVDVWKIMFKTSALWKMNFSTTHMMTTPMSLLNLSTFYVKMDW